MYHSNLSKEETKKFVSFFCGNLEFFLNNIIGGA